MARVSTRNSYFRDKAKITFFLQFCLDYCHSSAGGLGDSLQQQAFADTKLDSNIVGTKLNHT